MTYGSHARPDSVLLATVGTGGAAQDRILVVESERNGDGSGDCGTPEKKRKKHDARLSNTREPAVG